MFGNCQIQLALLLPISSINALLHDAAAVFVTSNFVALLHHLVIDKLFISSVGLPTRQQFEEHVVAIDLVGQSVYLGSQQDLD